MRDLPCVLVPGGVTLLAEEGEDAGTVQSIGARFAHDQITLEAAAESLCRACATPGGGCQFLGTAATSQVVGEALGMSLTHSALAPSGHPIWLDMARRSARAVLALEARGLTMKDILTDASVHNAMVVHAAFGGSTNLILHLPAVAHAAGLRRPTVDDWTEVNRQVPRLVDALPNGPRAHPTVQVFLAGGVPEVMLHLRRAGLLRLDALTVSGEPLGSMLDWWEQSERRAELRRKLQERDGVDPDDVIMDPDRRASPRPDLRPSLSRSAISRPEGSVIKSTAIDPSVVDADGVYRKIGPARVFRTEHGRHRGDQEPRRGSPEARRHPRADLPRADGLGHGRDLPDHLRAQAPGLRQARRRDHRRALQRRLDRRLHRARLAGSAGRRAGRQGARRRPDRNHHRLRAIWKARSTWWARRQALRRGRRRARAGRAAAASRPGARSADCPPTRASGPRCRTSAAAPGAAASTTSTRS